MSAARQKPGSGSSRAGPQAVGPRRLHWRRGTILVAVLVVVTLSALAATTAMYYGEAAAVGADVSLKRTRSRAMVWSGVQAVMAELEVQREKLLDGEQPLVTTQWELFESGGKRGVVRLVALERDEAGLERWLLSESAKLNLNAATAEMLGKLGPLDADRSAAVVSARDKGYSSLEELVRVDGVGQLLEQDLDPEAAGPSRSAEVEDAKLASLLTVLSFDPNVQAGIESDSGADARGKLRVNLNTEWSDSLAQAIGQRFDANAVNAAKALFDAGEKFKSMSDLVAVLRRTNLPPASWPPILDAFTVSPDPFIPARVDINQASARVLAAIPGISVEAADAMVSRRQGLDAGAKRTIVWPVTEGILKADEFVKAVDWLTTRSMQWRVRVEAGLIDMDAGESSREEPVLEERMAMEAVIDVASGRPRVAYLRDVTLMEAAATMAESLARRADASAANEDRAEAPPPGDAGVTESEAALQVNAKLKLSAGLNFGSPPAPAPPRNTRSERKTPISVDAPPSEPVDRRIGRWTSRAGSTPVSTETKP